MRQEQCAYCDQPATTRDHVPPGNLFTPPRPNNLITVPACDGCNHGASDDDEVFRNELSIMAGSFGESANAAERLQPSMRGIRRNKAARTRMVLGAELIERYSTGGIYLGRGYAVPVAPGVQERVITRIVRGLYWHHAQNSLDASAHVTLVFIDKRKPQWQNALSPLQRLPHVLIGDGKTFQYLYGQATDDPTFSVWLLIFFKGIGEQIILALTWRD
ncbi:MAG TPA: hypothetical protein VGP52_17555 [Stellaceae bacterium]|jgi:hypothetical protein|nr:hypothetical protein [Stellaceae bacterium]